MASKATVSSPSPTAASVRLIGDDDDDLENQCVLHGVFEAEVLPFKESVLKVWHGDKVLRGMGMDEEGLNAQLYASQKKGTKMAAVSGEKLLSDEIAAINLYTCETPIYRRLNQLLRSRQREDIKVWLPFLKLLLTALHKLKTATENTFYRGVHLDLSPKYTKGKDFVWWQFTSTTQTVDCLESFLGKNDGRTIFCIRTKQAVGIKMYSAIGIEDEYLIIPGISWVVKSALNVGGGCTMIQLEADPDAPSFIPGF